MTAANGVAARARTLGELLRAPLVFTVAAGLTVAAAARLSPHAIAMGVIGLVLGGWCGLWLARPRAGRADLRWLLPGV
ncbi:hypothetical protein, partial [Cognatilysobacter lacus]